MPDRFSEDYGVNARRESVSFVKDFRPGTLLEDNQDNGARVNKPEGTPTTARPDKVTAGGRGTNDAIAADKLGSQTER